MTHVAKVPRSPGLVAIKPLPFQLQAHDCSFSLGSTELALLRANLLIQDKLWELLCASVSLSLGGSSAGFEIKSVKFLPQQLLHGKEKFDFCQGFHMRY